ncbi:MAG: serine/threonine protein kinase [Planctomycetales bacterium]|nr:serine/threonine protein kinase [Planctomycetales bacterium]
MILPLSKTKSNCPSPEELSLCLRATAVVDDVVQQHIGDCQTCQATLQAIAADATWWDEVETTLYTAPDPAAERIAHSICALSGYQNADPADQELTAHELSQLRTHLQPPSHPELLGRIGRYELEQLVGRGGMGLVFRGHDTDLHRVVAIKTIASHLNPRGAARERFVREARASASLTHPHIVAVYDVITDSQLPAIVMQYIPGQTLEQWLKEQGPMPWPTVLQLGIQLADALNAAHESGLIHRDIKPGNVMLEAGCLRALIADFGLVRALDEASLTHTGALAGTPDFMSPEQARGQVLDQRSDLFSLGAVLYTMLTGCPPFHAPQPMAVLNRICHQRHQSVAVVCSDVPMQVSRVVDKLLQKQPRKRYASAAEVRDMLQQLSRSSIHLQTRRPMQLYKFVGLAAAVLAVALLYPFASMLGQSLGIPSGQSNSGYSLPGESGPPDPAARLLRTQRIADRFVDLDRLSQQLQGIEVAVTELEHAPAIAAAELADRGSVQYSISSELQWLQSEVSRLEMEFNQ